MVKVSFILPAYKKAYLKEAIASILAQSYQDFKLVVVDDASPENLKEIIDMFDDSRLSYYRNQENLGGKNLISAWTKAMAYAEGEFCIVASDDDIYHKDYLITMLNLSEKYPEVDLFHCRIARIDQFGKISDLGNSRAEFETQLQFIYSRIGQRYLQILPDFMFRLSKWRKIGGFIDFPVGYFSDDATWILIGDQGVACANDILFFVRNSGINISNRNDNNLPKMQATLQFMEWLGPVIDSVVLHKNENEIHRALVKAKSLDATCNFLYYLASNATTREVLYITKHEQNLSKYVRNQLIKRLIRRYIDKIIHFLTLNHL